MATFPLETALQTATALHQAGRFDEAERIYREILTVQPQLAVVWYRLGLIALMTNRSREAVEAIRKAANLAPQEATYHADLGVACWSANLGEQSIESFQRALVLRPDFAHVHSNLGDSLHGTGRHEEAIASYQRALQIDPGLASAHNNLGNVFLKLDRLEEAAASYRQAARLDPSILQAHSNLGDVLEKLGYLDEAMACTERVLALNPRFPGGHLNRGVVFGRRGEFEKAALSCRRALAFDPNFAEAHLNLGMLLLQAGHYREGWPEYEWRRRSTVYAHERNFATPSWNGGVIAGQTLFVNAEQGLGDTIQFLRYLPMVRERSRAARLILECKTSLAGLLRENEIAADEVLERDETAPSSAPSFDHYIPLLSLPLALGVHEPISPGSPYLAADAERRREWRERLGPKYRFRVGIVWAGYPKHRDDRQRSIAAEKFLPLLQIAGTSFYSLQVKASSGTPQPLIAQGLHDFTGMIRDFRDTAALLSELDLIVSVDTATAHLAGAMGRPVWSLLAAIPDWRWGLQGEQTAWYPTMRLFRQTKAGDWDSVIGRVAAALAGLVGD